MAQVQDPSPGSQTSADAYVGQLIQQALSQKQGSSGSADDAPLIPLWRVRPSKPKAPAPPGSAAMADRNIAEANARKPGFFQTGSSVGVGTVLAPGSASPEYRSVNYAEAYWLDMSPDDRKAFMEAAQKEGFWKPSQGSDGLVAAWGKAVSLAAQYNQNHDQSKWISPFEAVEKMSIADMANQGQAHDGFSTETSYRTFTQNELMSNAKTVLQQELGRNPTASEMKAFTAAVNAAAKLHPQTVTRQTVDDGQGGTSTVSSVTGGEFDPNAVIQDQVDGTQEHNDYQAATVYFPALMQALGATIG